MSIYTHIPETQQTNKPAPSNNQARTKQEQSQNQCRIKPESSKIEARRRGGRGGRVVHVFIIIYMCVYTHIYQRHSRAVSQNQGRTKREPMQNQARTNQEQSQNKGRTKQESSKQGEGEGEL